MILLSLTTDEARVISDALAQFVENSAEIVETDPAVARQSAVAEDVLDRVNAILDERYTHAGR